MSETYSIACKDCKKHIWIAQGDYSNPKNGHIYFSKEYLKFFFVFLIEHIGHNLIFNNNTLFFENYKEMEIDLYKELK